jgi:hypothetical protein
MQELRDAGMPGLGEFVAVAPNLVLEPTTRLRLTVGAERPATLAVDGRPVGLFHLSRTQHYLETVLGVPRVDLVLRDAVKPALRDKILREAVYAA